MQALVNPFVVLLSPAVDVLAAGFVTNGRCCDAVFQRILHYRLLKPHVLCYLIHSESGDLPFGFVIATQP